MNLLSVAAAYGVLTAVFEKGFGLELIGLPHQTPIQSFVPLLMFAILFGLSMDYQVFLSQPGPRALCGDGDNRKAVIDGSRHERPGDHVGGADHGHRLRQLHPQRRPDREAVRRRPRGRDRRRRDHRPLPAGAGDDVLLGERTGGFPGWLERILPQVGLESEESLPPLAPSRSELAHSRAE